MGLTLQIQVDGRPVPQLTARWQRLEVLHRIGDAHDTATLTLAAAGTALPLPPAGAQLVFQVTQEGERPLDLGGRFALRGLAGALLHESDVARNDPNPTVGHRLIAYDAGLPKSVIRFSTLHARTASVPCPAELRARRPSPMIDLYRKKTFSTRACRW